jgi:acetyl-CoA C-acetyltransferase
LIDPVVITGAARTPLGAFRGALAGIPAPRLGAVAIAGALKSSELSATRIDEVFMGCVLPAGLGQAPARQAARFAGIPDAAMASTISKVCGSGMKAVMLAHDTLAAGSADWIIAGGMENMSKAPYLLPQARAGYRYGHDRIFDHAALDGLEDAYEPGRSMGTFGEDTAAHYQFSRAAQDEYAVASLTRAQEATANGTFAAEIVPITLPATLAGKSGETLFIADEIPGKLNAAKIPGLKPAFRADGTVTAASSSANADGAAALLLTRQSSATRQGANIRAIIRGHAGHAQAPAWFTTAPIFAIRKLLTKIGWAASEVDLWEINEAFAVVTMAAIRDLALDPGQVNVNGGACALGHPIGATGARIIVTLLAALEARGLRRGIAALCIGGGEATAIAIERPA